MEYHKGNPGYIWPARQTVIAEYFTVPNISNVTDIRDILLLMVKQRKQLDLQLMDLPYGKGGFRKVYYGNVNPLLLYFNCLFY